VGLRTSFSKTLALELSRLGVTAYSSLSSLSSIEVVGPARVGKFTISYAWRAVLQRARTATAADELERLQVREQSRVAGHGRGA
jgi:hypothetical protein